MSYLIVQVAQQVLMQVIGLLQQQLTAHQVKLVAGHETPASVTGLSAQSSLAPEMGPSRRCRRSTEDRLPVSASEAEDWW